MEGQHFEANQKADKIFRKKKQKQNELPNQRLFDSFIEYE